MRAGSSVSKKQRRGEGKAATEERAYDAGRQLVLARHARSIAATSAGTVAASDSTSGARPRRRIASLVVGPIDASMARSMIFGSGTTSKKLSAVDALVNVTMSMSRNSSKRCASCHRDRPAGERNRQAPRCMRA